MYRKTVTLKSIQRQKEFETALLSMMERMEYKDISITALCLEVKTHRKTFYRYFDNIEDILYLLIDKTLEEAFLLLEVNLEIEKFFEFWKEKRYLLDILKRHRLSDFLFFRAYESCLQGMEIMGLWEICKVSYATSFMTMIVAWHENGMKQSIQEMAEAFRKMYVIY